MRSTSGLASPHMPALRRLACTATATTATATMATYRSFPSPLHLTSLQLSRRAKGDYGFNVFHNSNPQHGGSYARHERRMRDDEVEDFLKSVKHWKPVFEDHAADDAPARSGQEGEGDDGAGGDVGEEAPPSPSPLRMGEEAIMRTFRFETFNDAYLFMGRLWAFCYGSDKYPHVTWDGTAITVYLYSPSFRGLSKREARVAAFLNDQYNMARKSKQQQRRIVDGVVHMATVEEMMGEQVAQALAERQARRSAPLREVLEGPAKWSSIIQGSEGGEAKKREE